MKINLVKIFLVIVTLMLLVGTFVLFKTRQTDIISLEQETDFFKVAAQSKIVTPTPPTESETLDYKVWSVSREADTKGFKIVIVSVNEKHFNDADMTMLAKKLNERFAGETKIKVGLLDDGDTARLFTAGKANYGDYQRAERGRYYLDRKDCKEYVKFSAVKDESRKKIMIMSKCLSQ